MKDLFGCCGIYCGSCDHYLARQKGYEHLKGEENDFSHKLIEHKCCGCGNKKEGYDPYWKVNCNLKICNKSKGLQFCFECTHFPCIKLTSFKESFIHRNSSFGNLAIIKNRWTCENCGNYFSFYETVCNKCKSPLNGLLGDTRDR